IEHGAQILHHVGQALDIRVLGLRHAVLQQGKVVADPHVARVDGGGVAQFFEGRIKLGALQVVPGQSAVGDLVAGGRNQRSVLLFVRIVFIFIFIVFLVARYLGSVWVGRRGQRLQFLQSGFVAIGNSDLYFSRQRAGIRLGDYLGRDHAIVRSYDL